MANRGLLTKILGIAGTVLVLFPVVAPVLLSLRFIGRPVFNFDWLMPAELFPMALVGALLLLWAALRARAHRRLIGIGLGVAVGILFVGQGLAMVTGLASGETGRESPWMAVIFGSLAIYTAALVAIGMGGVLLLRDAFRAPPPAA